MPFIPHTKSDVETMLKTIGAADIAELFDEIPEALKFERKLAIPEGMREHDLLRMMREYANRDHIDLCFIGAGAYERHTPAAVFDLAGRGEFYTAYTPYQAEASQGTLQLLYEYQTMMANLTGMDVSNASLYDGASALAEAVLMAVRVSRGVKRILIPRSVHPRYRDVVKAIVTSQQIEIEEIPFSIESGKTCLESLKQFAGQEFAALVIPNVNFLGLLEDVDALTDWAHEQGALVIGLVDPSLLGLLKDPGHWGKTHADIVCGEGQSLGLPLASGGPYFGFMCCKQDYVRQMPGRIVGRTRDLDGKEGFTLTLQAREQHIRRSKATSNICTNQGLAVTMATIYMSLLGAEGLRQVALNSHANATALLDRLVQIPGVVRVFDQPFLHEFVVRFKKPVAQVLDQLSELGIEGGFDLSADYPELGSCVLICTTETKNADDLDRYAAVLREVIK